LFQVSNPPALLPQLEIYHTFFIFHQKYSNGLRFTTIVLCGTLSVMGSKYLEFPSAGALGCITASFTAGTGWRRRKAKNAAFNCDVEMYLNLLWKFLKPVSFSLIGKEVDFQVLTLSVLRYGFLILLIGVVFRLVSGYLSFCGGNMNWKEKAYITLSGFPKATGKTERFVVICSMSKFLISSFPDKKSVQAALGPVALDLARSQRNYNEEQHLLAQNVLVISVLAIILTAPLGKKARKVLEVI
jgi:solute carrier family 9B (sodium/hydrogen exchanger), member 1/2